MLTSISDYFKVTESTSETSSYSVVILDKVLGSYNSDFTYLYLVFSFMIIKLCLNGQVFMLMCSNMRTYNRFFFLIDVYAFFFFKIDAGIYKFRHLSS